MVFGRCALCQQDRELCASHIIPEFFYKPVYDEKHRFYTFSTDPADEVEGPEQKGLREHLLCKDCEGKLSAWEGYARKVIYGGLELEGSTDPQMAMFVLTGIASG
jgi:hypothetical protein